MLYIGMTSLTQLFASLLRIILLLVGIMLALSLATSGYSTINTFLESNNYPCLEVISSLVVIVPVIAIFYGQHIQKFFWQRMRHYNLVILLSALGFGLLMAFLPIDFLSQGLPHCTPAADLLSKLTYALGTSLVAAVFAFLGVDLGVILKHLSLHIRHKPAVRSKRNKSMKR